MPIISNQSTTNNLLQSFNVGNNGITFGDQSVVGILGDTFNPSITGQVAPVGSLFLSSTAGLFIKTSSSSTGWSEIGTGGSGGVTAGLSLAFSGSTLNVTVVNTNRLISTSGGLDISSLYVGQSSITTLGTITSGTWNATTIAATYGGTGLSSLGSTNQILGINSSGSALEYKTITGSGNVTISNSPGILTISGGGISSITNGTGISTSTTSGVATITNIGVTSLTGSTGINVSGTTGDITISTFKLYAENPISGYTSPAASGNNSIAIGYAAIANATKSTAIGEQSVSRIQGGLVHANGRFASSGDAQVGRYILRNTTVSNFPAIGYMDGTGGSILLVMPDNSTWTFRATITAQRSDQQNGWAGWEILGVVYRISGVDSINIQGTPAITQIASSNQNWSVAVNADTTNGALSFSFTGVNGSTIRWVALVETVEVTD
jgi:hypothetical protein